MARMLVVSMQKTPLLLPLPVVAFFVVLIGILSVFSVVSFLCGSHGLKRSDTYKREKKTIRLGDKKPGLSRLGSSLSSKALMMSKMISWRKVQDDGDDHEGEGEGGKDEQAVWKRTIIMGERCRPLDFSGKILYDENGNPLPETPPSSNAAPAGDNHGGSPKS